jgi:hypothetical protein
MCDHFSEFLFVSIAVPRVRVSDFTSSGYDYYVRAICSLEVTQHSLIGIEENGKREAVGLDIGFHLRAAPRLIFSDRNHLQPLGPIRLKEALDVWKLAEAGFAPSCPEVDEDRSLPPQVGKVNPFPSRSSSVNCGVWLVLFSSARGQSLHGNADAISTAAIHALPDL